MGAIVEDQAKIEKMLKEGKAEEYIAQSLGIEIWDLRNRLTVLYFHNANLRREAERARGKKVEPTLKRPKEKEPKKENRKNEDNTEKDIGTKLPIGEKNSKSEGKTKASYIPRSISRKVKSGKTAVEIAYEMELTLEEVEAIILELIDKGWINKNDIYKEDIRSDIEKFNLIKAQLKGEIDDDISYEIVCRQFIKICSFLIISGEFKEEDLSFLEDVIIRSEKLRKKDIDIMMKAYELIYGDKSETKKREFLRKVIIIDNPEAEEYVKKIREGYVTSDRECAIKQLFENLIKYKTTEEAIEIVRSEYLSLSREKIIRICQINPDTSDDTDEPNR